MDIARIDRATGVVVNIEVADAEWLAAQSDDPAFLFLPYEADQPAVIGLKHDHVAGFEQRAPEPVALTDELITALALTAKQRAVLAAAQPTPEGG